MDNIFVLAYALLAPGPANLFKRHDRQLLFIHSFPSADELFDCSANAPLGVGDKTLPGMYPYHTLQIPHCGSEIMVVVYATSRIYGQHIVGSYELIIF